MNARGKLNQAYLNGALATATLAGMLTQSAVVFLLVLIVLLASCLGDGSIRATSTLALAKTRTKTRIRTSTQTRPSSSAFGYVRRLQKVQKVRRRR